MSISQEYEFCSIANNGSGAARVLVEFQRHNLLVPVLVYTYIATVQFKSLMERFC